MKKRSFWGVFIVATLVTGVFFAIMWSFLFATIMELDFEFVLQYGAWGGVAFGLIIGLLLGIFLRTVSMLVMFNDPNDFMRRLQYAVGEIGYQFESQNANVLLFKPGVKGGLLAGKICVELWHRSASISGPMQHVKRMPGKMGLPVAAPGLNPG